MCDGEFIWIASSASGLRVFTLEGTQVGQLNSSLGRPVPSVAKSADLPKIGELPPFDPIPATFRGLFVRPAFSTLWLHPLEPGRCFVTGQFGKDERRWSGVVSRRDVEDQTSPWQFRLWHQATKQPAAADDDLAQTFRPQFFADYVSQSDPQRRWLLTGRSTQTIARSKIPRLLGFDVATGEAALFQVTPAMNPSNLQQVDHDLVASSTIGLARFVPLADRSESDFRSQTLFDVTPKPQSQPPSLLNLRNRYLRPELIRDGDWLYNPGPMWRRVATRTWNVEPLHAEPLARLRFICFDCFTNWPSAALCSRGALRARNRQRQRPGQTPRGPSQNGLLQCCLFMRQFWMWRMQHVAISRLRGRHSIILTGLPGR